MKKIYSILALAGMMLTITACSSEQNEPEVKTDDATVTFSVNLNDIDSRAISDGSTVDQLVFAVYDDQGNEIAALRQNDVTVENGHATVTTRLAMGQKYSFAFWAQKSGNSFYNTTDLKDVVVSYTGYANDESRDAFTASYTIDKVTGPINETITLYRPFAQLDYVCDIDEWTNLKNSIYKLVGTELVVNTGAYTHLNLLTGEASQPTENPITFAVSPYYTGHNANSYDFCGFVSTKSGDNYQDLFSTTEGDKFWLSMNYILATPEVTNLGRTVMNIYCWGSATGATPVEVALEEIPIQRNHRTVIYVSELTRIVKAVITIDPNFGGDF